MNNVKISVLGSDGFVCQIPRIKEGMEALGHVISKESPDIIYSNDPKGYDEALKLKQKYSSAYLIFNFLDVDIAIAALAQTTLFCSSDPFPSNIVLKIKADSFTLFPPLIESFVTLLYPK